MSQLTTLQLNIQVCARQLFSQYPPADQEYILTAIRTLATYAYEEGKRDEAEEWDKMSGEEIL